MVGCLLLIQLPESAFDSQPVAPTRELWLARENYRRAEPARSTKGLRDLRALRGENEDWSRKESFTRYRFTR